jgi:FkbM family methyltransferase
MNDGWFNDPELVASLPLRFRGLAWYSRQMAQASGRVRGGSFVYRRLRELGRLLRLGDTAAVRVGPYQVHVDLLDQRAFTVFAELRENSAEFRLLATLLPPGATFVDIGANHGSFSIRAASFVGSNGSVIAFEPNPRLAGLVGRSLDATGVPFTVHAVALGRETGTATLYVPDDSSGSASVFAAYCVGRRRAVRIPVVTGDSVLADVTSDRPCVVKLDVEGAEGDVLLGAASFLHRVRPIVLWELNPDSAAAAEGIDALFGAFREAGYDRFAELADWPATIRAADVSRAPQRNLLAVPS